MREGEFKKRMIAQSFRHGFRDVEGIEVMACNWFSNEKIRQRDIVQMNDVMKVLDEARKDFPCYDCNLRCVFCGRECGEYKKWFLKWFGEADASKTILSQELTDYLNSPREGGRK